MQVLELLVLPRRVLDGEGRPSTLLDITLAHIKAALPHHRHPETTAVILNLLQELLPAAKEPKVTPSTTTSAYQTQYFKT